MTPEVWLIILIVISLTFDFLNGFHDSANVVATMISSRAMSGKAALTLAAVANLVGPFLFGVAVAHTVGDEVAVSQHITISVVVAALLSASSWNIITWYFGIPASSSHGLIGGIIGAVIAGSGVDAIKMAGVWKIIIALLIITYNWFYSWLAVHVIGQKITKKCFTKSRYSSEIRTDSYSHRIGTQPWHQRCSENNGRNYHGISCARLPERICSALVGDSDKCNLHWSWNSFRRLENNSYIRW
jgi:hypothetical protein